MGMRAAALFAEVWMTFSTWDYSKRLADLHRCYSCASMRHASMLFPIYNAHVPADLALLDSQTPLATPISRDVVQAHGGASCGLGMVTWL
jgi:hypothetical protein